jgi:hypothetical protein
MVSGVAATRSGGGNGGENNFDSGGRDSSGTGGRGAGKGGGDSGSSGTAPVYPLARTATSAINFEQAEARLRLRPGRPILLWHLKVAVAGKGEIDGRCLFDPGPERSVMEQPRYEEAERRGRVVIIFGLANGARGSKQWYIETGNWNYDRNPEFDYTDDNSNLRTRLF